MTKTLNTMNVGEQLNKIASIVGGKAWGADIGKPRIYLNYRRDVKLFLSFEDAAYKNADDQVSETTGLFGVKVNCFIDDCRQTASWYSSQRQKAAEFARPAFNAALWFLATGNADEAQLFADEELELSDEASSHLINGRLAEARAAVGIN